MRQPWPTSCSLFLIRVLKYFESMPCQHFPSPLPPSFVPCHHPSLSSSAPLSPLPLSIALHVLHDLLNSRTRPQIFHIPFHLLFLMPTYMALLPPHMLGLGTRVPALYRHHSPRLVPGIPSLLAQLEVDSEPEKPVPKPKPEPKVVTNVPGGDKDGPARMEQKKMGRIMGVSLYALLCR